MWYHWVGCMHVHCTWVSLSSSFPCRLARERAAEAGLSNLAFQNPGLEEERLPTTPTFDLVGGRWSAGRDSGLPVQLREMGRRLEAVLKVRNEGPTRCNPHPADHPYFTRPVPRQ